MEIRVVRDTISRDELTEIAKQQFVDMVKAVVDVEQGIMAIGDPRWKGRRKELTRVRELLCDAMLGGKEYGSDLASLDRYFYPFAVAARAGR